MQIDPGMVAATAAPSRNIDEMQIQVDTGTVVVPTSPTVPTAAPSGSQVKQLSIFFQRDC
jgi:hypothetical protein